MALASQGSTNADPGGGRHGSAGEPPSAGLTNPLLTSKETQDHRVPKAHETPTASEPSTQSQRDYLVRLGYYGDAKKLSKRQASEEIDKRLSEKR